MEALEQVFSDVCQVSLWTAAGGHVFTWWPHEAGVTCLSVRGHGKAPLILSAGDCAAVSQFLPGAELQEVSLELETNLREGLSFHNYGEGPY